MNDDVAIVHEALRSMGWRQVAASLGIAWKGERIPCPIHNGKGNNFTLDERDGRLTWICGSQCGSGDVLSLFQHVMGVGFAEALKEASAVAGVPLRGSAGLTDEEQAERQRQREAYAEAIRNRPAERAKPLPDPRQSATVWDAAHRVTSDQEVANELAIRAIDPERVAAFDLARVISRGSPLPGWAARKGVSWADSGHRLIVQLFDYCGRFTGLKAWRVCGGDDDSPKRLPQSGFTARGLVTANRQACDMMRDRCPGMLVVCEGEPDWMVHAARNRYAVVGIASGSWTNEMADRIPFGSEVVIRTHLDAAGHKYADHIRETLGGRVQVWRNE